VTPIFHNVPFRDAPRFYDPRGGHRARAVYDKLAIRNRTMLALLCAGRDGRPVWAPWLILLLWKEPRSYAGMPE
jgi:hypothetical protein